jgi:hypothetical protein
MSVRWRRESAESTEWPDGYHDYTASDFRDGFKVPNNLADQIVKDYRALINKGNDSQIRSMVFLGGGNPGRLTKDLMERYGLIKGVTWRIATYFVRLAWNEIDRERAIELGRTHAVWTFDREDGCRLWGHEEAHGQKFAVRMGLVIDGRSVFPGSEMDCTCSSRIILRKGTR